MAHDAKKVALRAREVVFEKGYVEGH